MSRKIYVEMKVKLIIVMENQDAHAVLNDLDYYFSSSDENVLIEDAEIVDMEITDSK